MINLIAGENGSIFIFGESSPMFEELKNYIKIQSIENVESCGEFSFSFCQTTLS